MRSIRVLAGVLGSLFLLLPLAGGADSRLADEAYAQMRKWIGSRDVERRRLAAESLGSHADRADVAAVLAPALADADGAVRYHAAAAFWKLAEREAALAAAEPALFAALRDPDPAVRVQAAGALDRSGVDPNQLVAARRSVLAEGDWFDVALAARGLIGEVDAAELVAPLLDSLRRTPPLTGRDAFSAEKVFAPLLQAADGERAVPGLLAALEDPALPKAALITALGAREPAPPGWATRLTALASDADPLTRRAALEQLRPLVASAAAGRDWAVQLLPLVDDAYLEVRRAAVAVYGAGRGNGHPGVAALLARLQNDDDPGMRHAIARALGEIGDLAEAYDRDIKASVARNARPALQALLQDADGDVREAAARALELLDKGDATGTTVLQIAGAGNAAALQRLRDRDVPLTHDALFRAIHQREVQTVADLLDAGLAADTVADAGMTALHFAVLTCDYGRPSSAETRELVALLLRHGADPNRRDQAGGNTVLHRASSCDAAVVKQLVKGGARSGEKNDGKLSGFVMIAVTNTEAAGALLDAGHRPDAAERQMLQGMLAAEQDPAKRRLLQRALGAGALAVER